MTTETERPRRRLYLLHRWTGLLIALLGMLVFFSGAIATFHHELDARASRGDRFSAMQDLPHFDLDRAYEVAVAGVDARYRHQVDVFQGEGWPVRFFFHEHVPTGSGIEEVGVATTLDPDTLEVLERREGDRDTVIKPRPPHALAAFFIDLHIFLLMPETLGLIATGVVGFALLILIASGTLVHRPTTKKLLRSPRRHRSRLFFGDFHTLMGSWSLPYTIILALTGTFFSFAGVVLVPAMAMVAFDGDQEALIRTVVGQVDVSESEEVPRLQPVIEDAIARADGGRVRHVGLDQWGKPEANITVGLVTPSALGDTRHTLVYDGHTGAFLQAKPRLGTRPSFGNSLLELMADLHFGTLFGIVTKLFWGLFGLATCVLAASGLLIYVARQPDPDSRSTRFVRLMTVALAGGLPLAMGLASLAWVAAYGFEAGDPERAMTITFLMALAAAGVVGGFATLRDSLALTWTVSGLALLALPLLAPLATGTKIMDAWANAALRETTIVDGAFFAFGLIFLIGAITAARSRPAPASGVHEGGSLDAEGFYRGADENPAVREETLAGE